jgi:hypothetical protein
MAENTQTLLDLCLIVPVCLMAVAAIVLATAPYDRAGRRRYRLED